MKYFKTNFSVFTLLTAFVLHVQAQEVQIGSGDLTNTRYPICSDHSYSYTQQIYVQNQIQQSGSITKLRFYFADGNIDFTNNNIDWGIYMGHTTKTSFTGNDDWVPLTSMTEVFNGQVSYPAVGNWLEIILTTAFEYNNIDNLVVAIDENTPNYDLVTIGWGAFTSDENTGLFYRDFDINPNPDSPPTAEERTSVIAQIQLYFLNGQCEKPSELSITDISTNSANLTWTNGATETEWEIAYGTPGFNPDTEGILENTESKPFTLLGLSPSSSYQVYVKAICSAGNESEWSDPLQFNTLCPAFMGNINESFESPAAPPICWTVVYGSSNPPATNLVAHVTDVASDGEQSFRFSSYDFDPDSYSQWLITPLLGNASGADVSFKYRKFSDFYFDSFRFGYSTTGADVNSNFIWTEPIENIPHSFWADYEYTVPTGTKYIAIHYNPTETWSEYLYIDEFSVVYESNSVTDYKHVTSAVFPNPCNDVINIVTTGNCIMQVIDISGRIVQEKTLISGHNNVYLEANQHGLFLFQLIYYNYVETFKVFKP